MILWSLVGCGGVSEHERKVAELEADIERLTAELDELLASAPSRRPARVRGACLTPGDVQGTPLFRIFTTLRDDQGQVVGIEPRRVPKGSVWEAAGLQVGDRVVVVAGVELAGDVRTAQVVEAIEALGTEPLRLEVVRGEERVPLAVDPWCR